MFDPSENAKSLIYFGWNSVNMITPSKGFICDKLQESSLPRNLSQSFYCGKFLKGLQP